MFKNIYIKMIMNEVNGQITRQFDRLLPEVASCASWIVIYDFAVLPRVLLYCMYSSS